MWEGVGLPWGWQGLGGDCCASLVAGSPSSDGRSCPAIGSFGGFPTPAERKVHCCFKMGWLDSFKGVDDNMTKHVKLLGCERWWYAVSRRITSPAISFDHAEPTITTPKHFESI